MSRACSPGGRFSTDFETQAISNAINMDLRNPVGTKAQWWVFDSALTDVDPVYDTGDSLPTFTGGKVWVGPYTVASKDKPNGFLQCGLLALNSKRN